MQANAGSGVKLVATEEIEVPIERAFAMLTDFATWERLARDRGATVERTDKRLEPGRGMAWKIGFDLRGRHREATSTLTRYEVPTGIGFTGGASGFIMDITLDLVAQSETRTRLGVHLQVRAKTIAARLILQSLKLARSALARRFAARLQHLARSIENRHRTGGTV